MASKQVSKSPKASPVIPTKSLLPPGTGSERVNSVLVVLYGPPGARKTTNASTIEGAKWVVSDPNCISTLRDLNRLPPKEDIYEVDGLTGARQIIDAALHIAREHGPAALGCTAMIHDSVSQLNDWHQEDVANATGQRFLGDNKKENGYQQFNTEFGRYLDSLGQLARYIPQIVIAHADRKVDTGKGQYAGFSLTPKMSEKLGRTANWIFYQTARTFMAEERHKDDDYISISDAADGTKLATEVIMNTRPVGGWITKAPPHLKAEEPANLAALLRREGLLQ